MMSDWPAASAQFVWFISDASQVKVRPLFEYLVGKSPDTEQSNRIPSPTMPFLSVAQGAHGNVSSQLTLQPNRLDYVIQGVDANQFTPPILEDLGRLLSERLQAIRSLEIAGVVRCAVVLNLFEFCESHAAATETTNELIGNVVHFSDPSDLMLQVNRRKPVVGTSVSMNRLLRFSVASFQVMNVALNPQFPQAFPVTGAETFASNLYIDVNTVLTDQRLPAHEIPSIWDGLTSEALRLREVGSLRGLEG